MTLYDIPVMFKSMFCSTLYSIASLAVSVGLYIMLALYRNVWGSVCLRDGLTAIAGIINMTQDRFQCYLCYILLYKMYNGC